MERPASQARDIDIDAELPLALGTVRILRQRWRAPFAGDGVTSCHHLELSLLPRSEDARACFPAYWGPHRFEPIGEMFLLPAGEYTNTRSECRVQNSIVLEFTTQSVAPWVDFAPAWTVPRLRACLDIVNHELRALLFRIGEEARAPGLASGTMIELMAAQAVIELARHIAGIGEERQAGGLAPWRLRLIDERLMADMTPPCVAELAAMCNISVRHLTRAFRVSRGRSIGAYVLEHRITHAKKLIESGMTIKSVAKAMDFTASSNFTAAFRRATGETPRDYRQRVSRSTMRLANRAH